MPKRKHENCLVTADIAGPCSVCRAYQSKEVHFCGTALYCAEHCPEHKPSSLEWNEFKETKGEQLELI